MVCSQLAIHAIKTHLYMLLNIGRNPSCHVFSQGEISTNAFSIKIQIVQTSCQCYAIFPVFKDTVSYQEKPIEETHCLHEKTCIHAHV